MARYRTKDDVDLRWNSIRRRITAELDVQIKEWREAALNKLLSGAWERYTAQLERGEVKVLESHFEQFVSTALDDVVGMKLEDDEPPATSDGLSPEEISALKRIAKGT